MLRRISLIEDSSRCFTNCGSTKSCPAAWTPSWPASPSTRCESSSAWISRWWGSGREVVGRSDRLVYITRFDSQADREAKWTAFQSDPGVATSTGRDRSQRADRGKGNQQLHDADGVFADAVGRGTRLRGRGLHQDARGSDRDSACLALASASLDRTSPATSATSFATCEDCPSSCWRAVIRGSSR